MKAVLQYRASPGLQQQITALDFPTVVVDETDQDWDPRLRRSLPLGLDI
jgi:hypothetical protein